MKTLLLVHHNPETIGGYQTLSKYLRDALEADVWNVRMEPHPNYDNYDYFVSVDDLSTYQLPLDRPHTSYLLTPRRSAYDMYYFNPWYIRWTTWLYRVHDMRFMSKVSDIVTISHNCRNRIYKYYQRDADVIYPCVSTCKYHWEPEQDYWLAVQRIDKWKRIDLIIDAFRDMPDEKLCLMGELNPKMNHLVQNLPSNVRWEMANERYLIKNYAQCKGVISMGIDEDFGIVPLEALASGKHVIAPFEGGYIETLLGVGDLIHPTKHDLKGAMFLYSKENHSPSHCQEIAREFDYSVFREQWKIHSKFIVSECEQYERGDTI